MKIHDAEQFFLDNWNDKKHNIHNKAVIQACLGMIEETNLIPDVFIIAGWIHDMGKIINKEDHHIKSLIYLDKFIKENPKYNVYYDFIKDCIIHHRSDSKSLTIYGRVFQIGRAHV